MRHKNPNIYWSDNSLLDDEDSDLKEKQPGLGDDSPICNLLANVKNIRDPSDESFTFGKGPIDKLLRRKGAKDQVRSKEEEERKLKEKLEKGPDPFGAKWEAIISGGSALATFGFSVGMTALAMSQIDKGKDGKDGTNADSGDKGEDAIAAEVGNKGKKGNRGQEGPKKGDLGEQGGKGLAGGEGSTGGGGNPGLQGLPGERGDVGKAGGNGRNGLQGRGGVKDLRALVDPKVFKARKEIRAMMAPRARRENVEPRALPVQALRIAVVIAPRAFLAPELPLVLSVHWLLQGSLQRWALMFSQVLRKILPVIRKTQQWPHHLTKTLIGQGIIIPPRMLILIPIRGVVTLIARHRVPIPAPAFLMMKPRLRIQRHTTKFRSTQFRCKYC